MSEKKSWKKKLPSQFLFWLEAVGLEIVLVQPKDLTAFAAQYFERQLARRQGEIAYVPTHAYFHDVAAKKLRAKRFSVAYEAGAIDLKHSSHSYNLDDLCRRDSHIAHITFPDDDIQYKQSVELAMHRRMSEDLQKELDFTDPEMYIPHSGDDPIETEIAHRKEEESQEQIESRQPEKQASQHSIQSEQKIVKSSKTSVRIRDEVSERSISPRSMQSQRKSEKTSETSLQVTGDEAKDASVRSPSQQSTRSEARQSEKSSKTSVKSKTIDAESVNIGENELDTKAVSDTTIGSAKSAKIKASGGSLPSNRSTRSEKATDEVMQAPIITQDTTESGDQPQPPTEPELHYLDKESNTSVQGALQIDEVEPQTSKIDILENQATNKLHECHPRDFTDEGICMKCGCPKVITLVEGSSQTKWENVTHVAVGNSFESIPSNCEDELGSVYSSKSIKSNRSAKSNRVNADASSVGQEMNDLQPGDADNKSVKSNRSAKSNRVNADASSLGQEMNDLQPGDAENKSLKSTQSAKSNRVNADASSLGQEMNDLQQGDADNKSIKSNRSAKSNRVCTDTSSPCPEMYEPQPGDADNKSIKSKISAKSNQVNADASSLGPAMDEQQSVPVDVNDNNTKNSDANDNNMKNNKNFTQSQFSDNPTPGINVSGTISVAKTKAPKEGPGPVAVEVLAEADDEKNDIIDVEINLHCRCQT